MTTIEQIDQQIDAVHRAVANRLHFNPHTSSAAWQRAWDRCPDLRAREIELYRARGVAQQERDAQEHKVWQSAQREYRRRANKAGV